MFYAHAWLKIKVFTPAATAKYFESLGVPRGFSPISRSQPRSAAERPASRHRDAMDSTALVPLIAGTIVLVHGEDGWLFSNKRRRWEIRRFWIVAWSSCPSWVTALWRSARLRLL